MSKPDTNQASELDRVFYNPEHTKIYNPSSKPTGVVMTDFDIYQAKEAIQALIRNEKLKLLEGFAAKADKECDRREIDNWIFLLGSIVHGAIIKAELNKLKEAEL